jgi:hypothetical protein
VPSSELPRRVAPVMVQASQERDEAGVRWSLSVPGAAPTSSEDRVATRAHEEPEDDQDQTEDDLTLNELHDPDDDEDHCDEPQDESHVDPATHDVDASHPRVATALVSPDSSPNSRSLAPFVHLSRGRKPREVVGSDPFRHDAGSINSWSRCVL